MRLGSRFVEIGDLSYVRRVLERVVATSSEEYLCAPISSKALAASEVIAQGNWGTRNSYSTDVDDWVLANPSEPSADIVQLALRAIDRIVTAQSELMDLWDESNVLRDLWDESKKASDWHMIVADLRERVAR
jgi:hypothetical protein